MSMLDVCGESRLSWLLWRMLALQKSPPTFGMQVLKQPPSSFFQVPTVVRVRYQGWLHAAEDLLVLDAPGKRFG